MIVMRHALHSVKHNTSFPSSWLTNHRLWENGYHRIQASKQHAPAIFLTRGFPSTQRKVTIALLGCSDENQCFDGLLQRYALLLFFKLSLYLSIGKVEFSSVVPMLPRSESRHSPDRQILRVDMCMHTCTAIGIIGHCVGG